MLMKCLRVVGFVLFALMMVHTVSLAQSPPVVRDRYGEPLPTGAARRFGSTILRHRGAAKLQFTPDGRRLIAGDGSRPVSIFDAITGRKLREVGENSSNNSYEFGLVADGEEIICLGFNITRWNLTTGELLKRYDIGRCGSIAVAPDGRTFAVMHEHEPTLLLVDTLSGHILAETKLPLGEVSASKFRFDAAGQNVLMQICESKEIKPFVSETVRLPLQLWDTKANTVVEVPLPAGLKPSTDFTTVPGTPLMLFTRDDGPIVVWDSKTQTITRTLDAKDTAKNSGGLVTSTKNTHVARRTSTGVEVWDYETGKKLLQVPGDQRELHDVIDTLSPDGKLLAVGNPYNALIHLWEVDTGKERYPNSGHGHQPEMEFSPDGKTLISKAPEEQYHWNLATGEGKHVAKAGTAFAGYLYKTRGKDWLFRLDTEKQQLIVSDTALRSFASCPIPDSHQRMMTVSKDGQHLVASFQDQNHTVILWSPRVNKEPFVLTGHRDACQHLLFSDDGATLYAAAGTHNNYDVDVHFLYDVATGKRRHTLKCNSSPGYSKFINHDRQLITGGLWNDASCRVWDTNTGKQLAFLTNPNIPIISDPSWKTHPSIEGVAFSPNDRVVAIMFGSETQSSLAVWEVGTWKLLKVFPLNSPRAKNVKMLLSRGGRAVCVASQDTTIVEWLVAEPIVKQPRLSNASLAALVERLKEPDGYSAVWELSEYPEQVLALFQGPLKPAPAPAESVVAGLIAKLDAPAFRVRQDAQRDLLLLGDAAIPKLEAVAKTTTSTETLSRIQTMLEQLREGRTPGQLRQRRILALLELLDDPQARELLKAVKEIEGAKR